MVSLAQKIGQLMFVGIQGASLSAEERDFITKNNIGGVILFSRNIQDLNQVLKLTEELRNLKNKMPEKTPLFIGIDQEGGRVARLKEPFTVWPPLKKLGDLDSASTCFEFAEKMGEELKAAGFNVNFAPCVDVLTNPQNTAIGDRSLGSDAEIVSKLASALVRGYIKAGIIPCPKHFPGHGDTLVDSHNDMPVQKDTDIETLRNREFLPFRKSLRARTELLMASHILFPKIDPEWPAGLSEIFLKKVVREEFRYREIIISDDLDMKALRNNYSIEKIAVRSLQAGINMLLYCNEPASPILALSAIQKAVQDKELSEKVIDDSYQLVLKVKKSRLSEEVTTSLESAQKIIGSPEHKALSQNIKDGVLPKNHSQEA
jgi:beta-N-acetylhexosaminidase